MFVYEVVNNRGGRHDPTDIDANAMDMTAIIPMMSWILAEMVRFCSSGADTVEAMALIEELTDKLYPLFEHIDGRTYVSTSKLKPGQLALLLLYDAYPKRLKRQNLVLAVQRHGTKASTAQVAVHRLKDMVDDRDGEWKLRGTGREAAEEILRQHRGRE